MKVGGGGVGERGGGEYVAINRHYMYILDFKKNFFLDLVLRSNLQNSQWFLRESLQPMDHSDLALASFVWDIYNETIINDFYSMSRIPQSRLENREFESMFEYNTQTLNDDYWQIKTRSSIDIKIWTRISPFERDLIPVFLLLLYCKSLQYTPNP